MLSLTQITGIIIAVLLTGLFLVIGYQIVLILQETKRALEKVNQILDDTEKISTSIAEPLISVSGFLTGLKDGARLINWFSSPEDRKKHHDR